MKFPNIRPPLPVCCRRDTFARTHARGPPETSPRPPHTAEAPVTDGIAPLTVGKRGREGGGDHVDDTGRVVVTGLY